MGCFALMIMKNEWFASLVYWDGAREGNVIKRIFAR